MADLPNGRTVIRIISQRVAPSESAASCSRRGVWVNTDRAIGGDDRQDHHGEDEAGDEHRAARRGGRALEERDPADVVPEPPLDAHGGGAEDGDAPEAVDDARDRGQQIDDVAESGCASRRGAKWLMNSATAIASGIATRQAIPAATSVPNASGAM